MVHRSYVVQAQVLTEINSNEYSRITLDRLSNLNRNYPSISVTALPLSGVYSRYLFGFDKIDESLYVLNNETKYKDYLYFNENLKATIYNSIGLNDSAAYYSELAYNKLPGNPSHYEQYLKTLLKRKDTIQILNSFKNVNFKKDYQFGKIFLAGCLNLNFNNNTIKAYADTINSLYPDNTEIRVLTQYTLFGENNVKKALDLSLQATDLVSKNNFKDALFIFQNASELNPMDYTHFENAGFCAFKLNNFEEAINNFLIVIDSLNPGTGKSEYLLGLSYSKTGNSKMACKYLYQSTKHNFKPAFSNYARICK